MPDYIIVDDAVELPPEWWQRLERRAREAWTCTACEQHCDLTLVTDLNRFMSRCCTAPIRRTHPR